MKIQAENKTHTPCYPVIAAVAAMLTLPSCHGQSQPPQKLGGQIALPHKVESKEAGKEQRPPQPVMGKFRSGPAQKPDTAKPVQPPQKLGGQIALPHKVESKEAGKEQRSQQPVMGSVLPPLPPAKPEQPPQKPEPPQRTAGVPVPQDSNYKPLQEK